MAAAGILPTQAHVATLTSKTGSPPKPCVAVAAADQTGMEQLPTLRSHHAREPTTERLTVEVTPASGTTATLLTAAPSMTATSERTRCVVLAMAVPNGTVLLKQFTLCALTQLTEPVILQVTDVIGTRSTQDTAEFSTLKASFHLACAALAAAEVTGSTQETTHTTCAKTHPTEPPIWQVMDAPGTQMPHSVNAETTTTATSPRLLNAVYAVAEVPAPTKSTPTPHMITTMGTNTIPLLQQTLRLSSVMQKLALACHS